MGFEIGLEELGAKQFWRMVAAEFFGMIMLMVCVSTVHSGFGEECVVQNNGSCIIYPQGTDIKGMNVRKVSGDAAFYMKVAFGIGLSLASQGQTFGYVSGGHLNPAISLAGILMSSISLMRGIFFILAQMLGAIVGSAIVYGCTPKHIADASKLGANTLQNEITVRGGFGLELFFTFMYALVVFAVTDQRKNVESYGQTLAIGLMIMVANVCLVPYTNCGINPARSFGPAVVMGVWNDHWIFWIAPLLGGITAALAYRFIFFPTIAEA